MNLFSQRLLLRLCALPLLESVYLMGLVSLILTSWLLTDQLGALSGGWLANIFVFICFLRSPPRTGRIILAGSLVGHLVVGGLMGHDSEYGPGVVLASCAELLLACWLARREQPLSDRNIEPTLLLRLLGQYLLLAIPMSLLLGGLPGWHNDSPEQWQLRFFAGWLYHSLGVVLLLIPCLTISMARLKRLLTPAKGGIYLLAVLFSCGFSLILLQWLDSPLIFIAIGLALIALSCDAFFVSCWTLGLLFLTWLVLKSHWLPQPPMLTMLDIRIIWSSTIATLFFLQLIGLLSELMAKGHRRLEESEARMRGALEFAATGFALTSQQGEILEANQHLCRLLGYSREELKGLTAVEITHPDDAAKSLAYLQAIEQGKIDCYEFEKRYLKKDGTPIWVNVRLSLLNYSPRRPVELIVQVDDITKRKQTEAQLQYKETRLKQALSAANAGAWETNLATLTTWWADEIYRILRVEPEAIAANQISWNALIHPEDREKLQQSIEQAMTHACGYRIVYRLIRPDGSMAWLEDYVDVELNGEGEVCRLYGITQDVTERTLIELAVQQSESRLRAILNCAVDAIVTLDEHGRIHSFNPAAEKIFGYPANEVIGENVALLIPSPHKELHQGYIQRYLQTGQSHIIGKPGREVMAQHKSGRLVPVELSVTEINNQGERLFTGMIRDISAHKQAEAALIAARAELQSVINAAIEISIIATTPEGVITLFNTGAERMLGYKAAEVVGLRTPMLFHDMDEIVSRSIEITRDQGHPVTGYAVLVQHAMRHGHEAKEWSYVRKDGSKLTVLLTTTPIRDSAGGITGFLGIAKDISALKITEAELYRAKNQAELASKAKSEFLANMSHEIRTPLNAVLGMAYLLKGTPLNSSQEQYVKMISGAGRSLLLILNDILDFSKIEAGRMEISPTEFNLDDILDGLASIMSVNAAEKDLDLMIGVQPDVPRQLFGDGMRLQQILINLTGNAIKFTHQGHVSLDISIEPASSPTRIRFSVTDTGIGMSQSQLDKLFAPFTQADSSMTRQYGGTGLGLAICKRLVELMSGQIGVRSQLGQGSEFWVALPLPALEPSVSEQDHRSLKMQRLLILDDNPQFVTYLRQATEALGWQSADAATVEEASRMLDLQSYDTLLLGWPSEQTDPLALLQDVERWPQTGLIAMTRLHQKESLLMQPLAERIDSIIVQPVTSSNLYNAVLEVHQRKEGGTEQLLQQLLPARQPVTDLHGIQVLLVEDNEINQLVASKILQQAGASVEIVNNGQEAVERLRQPYHFSLILMDVQMPVMDGFTATRILRQELAVTIPILAMTAGVMSSEQEECRRSGMNDIIAKPVDVQQMLQCIASHLRPELSEMAQATPPIEDPDAPWDLHQLTQTLGGDTQLMVRLLTQFQQETRRLPEELHSLLESHDDQSAARLIHTLKGHAGTFGSRRLAQSSKQLEQAIRDGLMDAQNQFIPELLAQLAQLQQQISSWLAQQEQAVPHPAQVDDFQEKIKMLGFLLQENNLSALDLLDEIKGSLQQEWGQELAGRLVAAMESLDFSRARQLLEARVLLD